MHSISAKKAELFLRSTKMNQDNNIMTMWHECQVILQDNLTTSAYQTWFAPIAPLSFNDGVLVLQVRSPFIAQYIEENYISILSKVIFRVFGPDTRLNYQAVIDAQSGASSTIASANGSATAVAAQPAIRQQENTFDTQLNASYTFDTFIAGEPNKLARVAGLKVAELPGYTAFNPLFIYGGSGVGKTHLACAIGNQVKALDPSKKVLYVSANTFKLQYMAATQEHRIPDFLNFYQQVDVLIVDDIQYFAHLDGTQDTFFHIFNYLQQSHKQLILTSDRMPLQLKDIEDRLLTRFKWGLSAEITRPDFQLRKDILLSKMHRDGVSMAPEIVDFIANNVRDSIRDLEGVMASLLAYSTLTNCEIDMALAEQVVGRIVEIKPMAIDMSDILGCVSEHFNVPQKAIVSDSRSKEVMEARHVSIYLARELTEHSLAEIGNAIGGRTHATVLHSLKQTKDWMSSDPVFRHKIIQIKAALTR